jgi:hypothetical protein
LVKWFFGVIEVKPTLSTLIPSRQYIGNQTSIRTLMVQRPKEPKVSWRFKPVKDIKGVWNTRGPWSHGTPKPVVRRTRFTGDPAPYRRMDGLLCGGDG